jgi:hypothetical protein
MLVIWSDQNGNLPVSMYQATRSRPDTLSNLYSAILSKEALKLRPWEFFTA